MWDTAGTKIRLRQVVERTRQAKAEQLATQRSDIVDLQGQILKAGEEKTGLTRDLQAINSEIESTGTGTESAKADLVQGRIGEREVQIMFQIDSQADMVPVRDDILDKAWKMQSSGSPELTQDGDDILIVRFVTLEPEAAIDAMVTSVQNVSIKQIIT